MKIAAYQNYKSSGADWLGDVPSHWTVKAIKWESPVLRGASPRPIDDPIYFDDEGDYAWVRISDVTNAGTYLESTEQSLSDVGSRLSVKLQPGCLFLSIAGSVGKPCIPRIKCCIHDGFVYFPRWKADTKFLYYIFASGEPYKGLGKMGTQLNLNTDTVGSIVIGLPEEVEQQAIARFLDAKTAQIDSLVAKKRQLIGKLKEKRSALIARTVTRGLPPEAAKAAGLEPNPTMKDSGESWIGEMPVHWQAKKGSHLGRLIGSVAPAEEDITDDDDGISYAKVDDLNYLDSSLRLISTKVRVRCAPPRWNTIILFPKRGAAIFTNKVALAMGMIFDSNLMGWDIYKESHPKFVAYCLIARRLDDLADVSTVPQINNKHIYPAKFPHPPRHEQEAIVAYINIETGRVDQLVGSVEDAIDRLTEYRQALITSAVTGKIDVRHFDHTNGVPCHAPVALP